MNRSRFALVSALLLATAAPVVAQHAAPATPARAARYAPWGIDLSARDTSVKAGDDFNRYANGTWLQNTQIPASSRASRCSSVG